jgi:hypothetical protein
MKPAAQNQFNIEQNSKNKTGKFYTLTEKNSDDKLNKKDPFYQNIRNKEKITLTEIKNRKATVCFNSHSEIESFWYEYGKDSNNSISDKLYVKVTILINKFVKYKIEFNNKLNVQFLKILEDISNNFEIDQKKIFSRLKQINNDLPVCQNSKLPPINNSDKPFPNLNVFKAGKRPSNEWAKSHAFFDSEIKKNTNDRDRRIRIETQEANALEAIMNPNTKATVYFNSHQAVESFWDSYKEENELISDTLYEKVLTLNTILKKYTADKNLLFENQYNISFLKILEEISNVLHYDEQYVIEKLDSIKIEITQEIEIFAKLTDKQIKTKCNEIKKSFNKNSPAQENISSEKENNEKSHWKLIKQAGEFVRKNFYRKTAEKLKIGLLFIAAFITYYYIIMINR